MKKSNYTSSKGIPSPFPIHPADLYHEAMELLAQDGFENGIRALQLLEQAYKLEPERIELQLGYIEAYNTLGIHASIRAHIEHAYKMVREKFPRWPKQIEWGDIDNRGYLRVLQCKADWLWEADEFDEALALYSLILKLNPHDNQGVRYVIAAIHAGLSGPELDLLWKTANDTQDFSITETLLEKQNRKHHFWQPPDEDR